MSVSNELKYNVDTLEWSSYDEDVESGYILMDSDFSYVSCGRIDTVIWLISEADKKSWMTTRNGGCRLISNLKGPRSK